MKGYTHLSPEQRAAIHASYQRTHSTVLTAREVGMPVRRVAGALARDGMKLSRSRVGACYRHAEEVKQWAAEGVSLSEIARRIGTKHQLVAKYIRELGLERTPFEQKMEHNPAWNGGKIVDKHGYILVKQNDHPNADRHGYVREHRLVMEQKLGRLLLPTESVHHKDGNKANNHPDNLELFASNGQHLAETLKGQRKNMTTAGRERLRAIGRQTGMRRRNASQKTSAPGGSQSPDTNDQISA